MSDAVGGALVTVLDAAGGPKNGQPLENLANKVSAPSDRDQKRRDRWAKRAVLWKVSELRRVAYCGRVPRGSGVTVRARDGVAGFAGLQRCGSVWADPVCASQILTHRALEIGAVLGEAVRQGYGLGFFTLTMRHNRRQRLRELWDAAGKGWRRVITGRGWVAASEVVDGWVRVWEVTQGRNGWHVHVHGVMVLRPEAGAVEFDQVMSGAYERWSRGLVAAGLEAPRRVGQEWHVVAGDEAAAELGRYLFKFAEASDTERAVSLGLELAYSLPGRSADGLRTRPVWSLLDDLVLTGDAEALERWHEWERDSKGRRQVGWSTGLRDRFAPVLDELSDDQVVAVEHGSADDDLVLIEAEGWRVLVSMPWEMPGVLEAAEAGGAVAVALLLESLGVDHQVIESR